MLGDFDDTSKLKEEKQPLTFKKVLREWVLPYGAEILAVVLFVKFVAFFTFVPTGSMETTIPEKSCVISTRLYNASENVERGDIIVFESDELGITLVKRCIGLPGDTVEFDGEGNTYINGEYYDEPYVSSYSDFEGSFEVPEGCYFFCGDNRRSSFDARFWDDPYIEKENVKGIARFIVFPFGSFGLVD